MKRCPQCEFIYEDDQKVCDMDGSHLAFDSRLLPHLQALNEIGPSSTSKRNWKGHTVPVFASLILVGMLFLVYYVSMSRVKKTAFPPAASVPASATELPRSTPAPAESPAALTFNNEDDSERIESNENDSAGRTVMKETSRSGSSLRSRTMSERVPAARRTSGEKKDSKVGSILKKTGKILKRPFKF
jgi:hypothetical protein